VIAALRVRRELSQAKFLVYQDNPGEGQQAPIFKRFYWWESECTERMMRKFGITIEKRSFKELGARAKALPDDGAEATNREWKVPTRGVSRHSLNSATKLYQAVRQDLDADPNIRAVGINCLNESHFSDTTPCLAWNRLYMEGGFIWGCEGDTVSMLTKFILHRSLGAPVVMTNLYPFLLGDAALKHERISNFPKVKGDPRDYILVAHCGYLGVVPQTFATSWELKPKVLSIVDENAAVMDARLPEGSITLAKIHPNFDRITVAEGELEGYAQYPGSDCLNGGVVRVANGPKLMTHLASHHYILMTGHQMPEIEITAPIFGLEIESI
jgi:L-fucose isomerase-like protein